MDSPQDESQSDWSESEAEDAALSDQGAGNAQEEDVTQQLRQSLKELPLKELEEIKRSGINGVPLHKAIGLAKPSLINAWLAGKLSLKSGTDAPEVGGKAQQASKKQQQPKRKNKNAPLEVSSKTRVSRNRQVVSVAGEKTRDPRFNDLYGTFRPELFSQSYGFLQEHRDKEIQDIKDMLAADKRIRAKKKKKAGKKGLTFEERGELMSRLTQLEQVRSRFKQESRSRSLRSKINAEERKKVASGVKKPFHLKKREFKKLELTEKYNELKSSGQLDRYVAKRRKKNVAKERKYLPGQ